MKRIESAALLVRSVPYGEADLVATFFTEVEGKIGAVVRGARRSSKRFGGALEPIHELFITLEDKGRELGTLKEARIQRPRTRIVADLEAMEAAGRALRWVRHLCPPRTPEPAAWGSLSALFDALDGEGAVAEGERAFGLVVFGLRLLADVGYALDFERCVRCGKACPEGKAAFVDPERGGLVCLDCGGARTTIASGVRRAAVVAQRVATASDADASMFAHAPKLLAIVEEALASHTGFDPDAVSKG